VQVYAEMSQAGHNDVAKFLMYCLP